jgi:hypothetical protein
MLRSGNNMPTLQAVDEAREHYEREAAKAEKFLQLKHQIARVRAALNKLDEVLDEVK